MKKALILLAITVLITILITSCTDDFEQPIEKTHQETIDKDKVIVPTNGISAIDKDKVVVPTNG